MVVEGKRICVTLPIELVEQLNDYVKPGERNELIAELLTDYVDALIEEDERMARVEARREQAQLWLERIRYSSRRAADMFLP